MSGGLKSGGLMSGGLKSGGLMSGGLLSGGLKSAHRGNTPSNGNIDVESELLLARCSEVWHDSG